MADEDKKSDEELKRSEEWRQMLDFVGDAIKFYVRHLEQQRDAQLMETLSESGKITIQ